MTPILFIEQMLNGLGYGLMLFLLAAGLTLVFGIMDVMNLAHGSLFMGGAYVAASVHTRTDSFVGAMLAALVVVVLVALVLEALLVRRLYGRDHLAQVLATFGIILVADDLVKMAWGPAPIMASAPAALSGAVEILPGLPYPAYRLVILVAGLVVAFGRSGQAMTNAIELHLLADVAAAVVAGLLAAALLGFRRAWQPANTRLVDWVVADPPSTARNRRAPDGGAPIGPAAPADASALDGDRQAG